MKPCKRCGGTDRFPSGGCKKCGAEDQRIKRIVNAEAIKANRDKWREKNKEKLLAQGRAWKDCNREFYRSLLSKYRKFKVETESNFTSADIVRKFIEQQGACAYCGIDVVDDYHIDHRVPISKGGTNDAGNIQVLCPTCNGRKGAKLEEEFFEYAKQKNYEVRLTTKP